MKFYPSWGRDEGETRDIFESREAPNLLEPLKFEGHEFGVFIRDNRCALCAGHLLAEHTDDRKYVLYCPEHGYINDSNHISAYDADQVNQGIVDGKHELRDKPQKGKTEDEILKELGFNG